MLESISRHQTAELENARQASMDSQMSRYLGVGNVNHTTLLRTLLSIHYFSRCFHSRIFQPCSLVQIDSFMRFVLQKIQRPEIGTGQKAVTL